MIQRQYKSYEEYKEHQTEKTKMDSEFKTALNEWEWRKDDFLKAFKILDGILNLKESNALCLGARYGCEVDTLRYLGCDALGVDLVPRLPLVVGGDFHNLDFKDESYDLVYSNALDHVYDMKKFLGEASRVLKHNGILFLELPVGQRCEGVGVYECIGIESVSDIIKLLPEFIEIKRERAIPRDGLNVAIVLKKGRNIT